MAGTLLLISSCQDSWGWGRDPSRQRGRQERWYHTALKVLLVHLQSGYSAMETSGCPCTLGGRRGGGVGSSIVNQVHIVIINSINIQALQTLYSSPAKHYVQHTSMHIHNYNYMPHPYDSVKFCGSDLLGPLHSSCHLLLMLLGKERDHLSTDGIETLGYLSLQGEKAGREGGRERQWEMRERGREEGREGEGEEGLKCM